MNFILTEVQSRDTGVFQNYTNVRPDVGGQHCPDLHCAVSVGQNQVQIRYPDTRKPSRLKISDFDRQAPYSRPGQNPDSVRRRLRMTVTS